MKKSNFNKLSCVIIQSLLILGCIVLIVTGHTGWAIAFVVLLALGDCREEE